MGSTAGTTYKGKIEGKLITAITTGTTTGITYKIKQVNGATPTHPTAAHRLHIEQKTALVSKHEIFDVAAGTTQSGQTVTLGTVTRALPLSDGTDFTGSGTAQSFGAGADIFLTWDEHDAAMTPKTDIANTFTGVNTFGTGGAVRFSGTDTSGLRLKSLTTSERDALTAANGDFIYNTTTGVVNQYVAGAWAAVGTDATANASTTVAGKAEEAILSELSAGTAAGGTGARLFVNPSLFKKTSSGAAEGNAVMLNSASMVDGSLGGTGVATPVLGAILIGGGAGAAMTAIGPGSSNQVPVSNGTTIAMGTVPAFVKPVYLGASDSGTIGASSTSIIDFDTHTYTIPANDLVAGVAYEVEGIVAYTVGAGNSDLYITVGTTNCTSFRVTPTNAQFTHFRGTIRGTAAAGASVAVRTELSGIHGTLGAGPGSGAQYSTNNLATNGTLALKMSHTFLTSNGSNSAILKSLTVKKISITAF